MRRLSPHVILAVLLILTGGPWASAADEPTDYLALVRGYADAMIARGRDTYGGAHSPLFAAALDRKTFRVFEKMPPDLPSLRRRDRTFTGANPMHDLNLYQTLYALTSITGERRYAGEADAALKWFFEHCQSPKGLMAWGEHQGWSFLTDSPSAPRAHHEFFHPWVLAERTTELVPDAMRRLAIGLWEHQIGDHETGAFSRHARRIWEMDQKSGGRGNEFPRHGGFYIELWAREYERSRDPAMLKAIDVLLRSFLDRRDPTTGAIPFSSQYSTLYTPMSTVSLAISLHDAARRVPKPLAERMRAVARQIDEVFLKAPHDPGGRGFVRCADAATMKPGDTRPGENARAKAEAWGPYSHMWATGYGMLTDANAAILISLRLQQTGDKRLRVLVLKTADAYLNSMPDLATPPKRANVKENLVLYPIAMAEAVWLEVTAYRLTGEQRYLARAEDFGAFAVRTFFTPGNPLPRVGSAPEMHWYEALSGGDTLMMALLDLWVARHRPEARLDLVWCNR